MTLLQICPFFPSLELGPDKLATATSSNLTTGDHFTVSVSSGLRFKGLCFYYYLHNNRICRQHWGGIRIRLTKLRTGAKVVQKNYSCSARSIRFLLKSSLPVQGRSQMPFRLKTMRIQDSKANDQDTQSHLPFRLYNIMTKASKTQN